MDKDFNIGYCISKMKRIGNGGGEIGGIAVRERKSLVLKREIWSGGSAGREEREGDTGPGEAELDREVVDRFGRLGVTRDGDEAGEDDGVGERIRRGESSGVVAWLGEDGEEVDEEVKGNMVSSKMMCREMMTLAVERSRQR